MSSRRARKRSDFQRRPGNRAGRRVLIACEGDETEPGYLEALKRELRLGAMVVITGWGTPSAVVADAARRCRRARREGAPFDTVWCVFDRDHHEDFERALQKAREQGMRVAPSVPCFELWLLLHYRFTTRPFECYADVARELRNHLPGYKKTADWDALLVKRTAAREHAERLLEHGMSVSVNGIAHPNPSTRVHELIAFLEALRPGQRGR